MPTVAARAHLAALSVALCALSSARAQGAPSGLLTPDWLVAAGESWSQPSFVQNADGSFTLSNGLVSRTFVTQPAFGTVDLFSHATGQSLLRAFESEGYVALDGVTYALGGLIQTGTTFHAFINRSATGLEVNPDGWNMTGSFALSAPTAPFPWTPGTRGSPASAEWPPRGLAVSVTLAAPASAPASHKAVSITITYEMYPGVPLLTQWLSVSSLSPAAAGVVVTGCLPVSLRLAQPYSPRTPSAGTGDQAADVTSWLYVQTDQAHGTDVLWPTDGAAPASPGADEAVLQTNYSSGGPGVILSGGAAPPERLFKTLVGDTVAEFVSFRTFLLVTDTYDAERLGLSVRRLYRLWAPHAQENPIFFHATDTTTAGFQLEIDQMAEVGFEMLIYSFGSGFTLETADPAYLAQVKAQIAYAKSKGIEVGGYDLICLDRGHGGYGGNVGDQWDRVLDDGSLGLDACFASGWVDKLNNYAVRGARRERERGRLRSQPAAHRDSPLARPCAPPPPSSAQYGFINETGLSMLETDGPYGGGSCASTNHTYHKQLSDSVYMQTQTQARWYSGLRERNIYINQPDNFFFQGGQRTGMGYDEDQYSLPRWQDVTVSRMTVYDQTCVSTSILASPCVRAGGSRCALLTLTYVSIPTDALLSGTASCPRWDGCSFRSSTTTAAVLTLRSSR